MSITEILERLEGVKSSGAGWTARCPSHDDHNASLSVTEGEDGRILLKCFAGCSVENIVSGRGLKMADLFPCPTVNSKGHKRRIVATYDYTDENGLLLFQCVRYEPKDFRQRRPDPAKPGQWLWNLKGLRRVLYRLPEVLAAIKAERTIFLVEGEKDCEALAKAGFVGSCNPMGAGKWLSQHTETLRDSARVIVIADKDKPGREHARFIASALHGVARSVKVIELPDVNGKPVKDAFDFLGAAGTADELRASVEVAPDFTPSSEAQSCKAGNPAREYLAGDSDDETFGRLANLSLVEYDRCRETEAKRLGVRVGTLDNEVAAKRPQPEQPVDLPEVEPWTEPVDGAALLEEIAETYQRFCVLPRYAAVTLAACLLQTYCYRLFQFVGVVVVWSPEPECGKGRVLDVTEALASHPFRTANTSAAVLYHSVSNGDITVLIDELDSQNDEQREAIGNILKSGFQDNGKAHRMTERYGEQVVQEFSTFAPKMGATIRFDTLDKATRTRAISIRMTRKSRDAKIAKFRHFDGTDIQRKCRKWVKDNTTALRGVGPIELDECATDRQEDVWEPLVAIARVAGGKSESLVREAAHHLSGKANAGASETLAHQVLAAMHAYFADNGVTKVDTKSLIKSLNGDDDMSDSEINRGRGMTPSLLGKLMRYYEIESRNMKMPDGKVAKGYYRNDFDEAFKSFIAPSASGDAVSKRYSATKAENIEQNSVFTDATTEEGSLSQNANSSNEYQAGSGVAAQKAEAVSNGAKSDMPTTEELLRKKRHESAYV